MNLLNQTILVTGGTGFIGTHVIRHLKEIECKKVFSFNHNQYNLTKCDEVNTLFQKVKPDIVIHLAAKVGGIQSIVKSPGTYYYENMLIGTHVLEACRYYNVSKVTVIGTNCSYPENINIPFQEKDFFSGYPQKANASYGIAKRALYQQCLSYKEQYGLNFAYLIPTNSYGEGDHFDENSGHVIPSLIMKFAKAKKENQEQICLWGSGEATREFMYVNDTAKAIVEATYNYDEILPLNIGTGHEIKIKELASLIAEFIGYKNKICWDTTKNEGYKRKCLDSTRMYSILPNMNCLSIDKGLLKTIQWAIREGII